MLSECRRFASEQLSKPWEKLRLHRPAWWVLALFFAAYVSAGWFGQGLALIPGVSIMFWPPAGIFLAALLLAERTTWPWWVLVGGAAELTCNAIWFHNPLILAVLFFGANAAEAATGAWLIQRFGGKPFRLETLSDVAALVLFGGMVAPIVGATLIALIDASTGRHPFTTAWPLVWLGDGSGLLVSTPITLVLVRAWHEREKIDPGKFLEAVTIGLLLTAVLALCARGFLPTVYLALPLMLWAAVRFQLHGAPAAVALVTLLTAIFTMGGHGEFTGQPEALHARIVMLQTFLGIAAVSTLLVGALSWHRHEALARLQEINEHLEAKVAERTASLEATTRRLQLALEGSGAGFWEADSTAGEFFASARTLALFGQALNSPINYDAALALVHPGDRARVESALRCTLDTGAPYRVEFRVPLPNGSIRWLISQADLRMEAGGQRIIGLVQDITERKEAEERLRASEQRYRRLHESLRDAFVVVDMDGHIVECNTAYCELLDYDRDELARLTYIDLTPAKWHAFEARIVAEQILPLGSSDVYEKEYRRRDGTIIPVELRTFLIRDGANRPQMWAIVRDITTRKNAEEELGAVRKRLEAALNASQVVLFHQDRELRYTWIHNPALGSAIDEVVGKRDSDLFQRAEDVACIEAIKRSVVESGIARREEVCVVQDGEPRYYDLVVQPDRDVNGAIGGVNCAAVDVTARKRAEAALRETEVRFRNMADTAPAMHWVTNEQHQCTFLSRGWLEFTGQTEEQGRGLGWSEPIHPDDRAGATESFLNAATRREPFTLDYRLRRRDGEYHWVIDTGHPRFDEQRRFLGFIGSVIDVNERKKAEERVHVAGASFQQLVEQSPFGVYAVDADFRLVMVSAGAQKVFQNVRPLLGRDFEEVLRILWPEPFVSEALAHFRHTLATGEPYSAPSMVEQRADIGETEAYDWKIERVILPDGRPGVVCHFYDLSERQRYEALLRDTDRKKDEFLATLAHELRNPLAPIRTGLQLMKLAADDAEAVEDSRLMMERQVEQMTRLIDDLMDVSRINRGRIELRREHVELEQVVRAAVETSRPLIEEYEHALTVSLPSRPVVLDADLTRLAQVFSNLLNNAAKYMDSGGNIQLVAEQQGSDVVVSVRDAGIGIPADELPTIFDMFTQVDRALSRSRGGLGIGLGLVKKLVEMHGGTIEVHSDGPGTGSEFTVRLPMLQVAVPSNERSGDGHRQGLQSDLRILVVDDNLDAAKTTGMLLKVMGNRVQLAHDGEAAVASAEKFRPHVVLCDIGLPKLNGYEVCQRIRAESWGEEILLIAVTGWGQDNDRQIAEAAGFDQYLVKPVEPRTLMKLMADLGTTKAGTSAVGSRE